MTKRMKDRLKVSVRQQHDSVLMNQRIVTRPRKRAAPANASADTAQIVKQAKTSQGATRRRVKTSDYSGLERSVLKEAQVLYRCAISTIDAFPSPKTELDLVYNAWADACISFSCQLEPDAAQIKLVSDSKVLMASADQPAQITERGCQLRGELKHLVVEMVKTEYGLKKVYNTEANRSTIRKTYEKVKGLLEKDTYTFKVRTGIATRLQLTSEYRIRRHRRMTFCTR